MDAKESYANIRSATLICQKKCASYPQIGLTKDSKNDIINEKRGERHAEAL